jgi:hypothetical protein
MKTALAAVALAAALVAVPTAAMADSQTHHDKAGDVLRHNNNLGTWAAAPSRAQADLLSTTVTHSAKTVRFTMKFRSLNRTGTGLIFNFFIRTPRTTRILAISAHRGDWRGAASVLDEPTTSPVACHVTYTIDYTHNLVRGSVPRSCLGNPRWIRVAFLSSSYDTTSVDYSDQDRTAGNGDPVYGPRIYR